MDSSPVDMPSIEGAGVGLRTPHIPDILERQPIIPWLELLADNWIAASSLNQYYLHAISERYPLTLHGVGLSLGAVTPLDTDYLQHIKALQQQTGALWYSEHCSFSQVAGLHADEFIPDLLPLPYTEEAISHVSTRIRQVQDFMGQQLLLENVSSYIEYPYSQIDEVDFLNAIAEAADCWLLLDINNVYVTACNQQRSPMDFLQRIRHPRVKEIHLAGFQHCNQSSTSYLLDAHNQPVDQAVWSLYHDFIAQFGAVPTLIEWDSDLPSLDRLLEERLTAERIIHDVTCHTDAQVPSLCS